MKQKMFFITLISAILVLPLLACLLFSQVRLVAKPETVAQVDERLAQMARDGIYSGSALIAQDGVVLLSQGYGLADRAQGIPNTPQTRFHLGSMTKQFTAVGILILQSQGKLCVQDPICNFFEDCPKAWQGITIHHLLTHTSGLSKRLSNRLYLEIEGGTTGPVAQAEQAQYLGLTSEWPVGSQPGEQHVYNNFGYILLAHIIEEVSGQSYADFLEQSILTPLGMHNTGYQDSSSGVAKTYFDKADTTGAYWGSPAVSGGSDHMYSTTEDLLLWIQALDTDQLLPQELLEPLFEIYVPETDLPIFGYGYGSFVAKILGRPVLMATGGGQSFVTIYFHLPADGLTLIVLTNQGAVDYISMMMGIVAAISGALLLSDLIFALSAIAFMLLLAVLLAAQKEGRVKTTWVTGVLWLLLAVPLALVFYRYLAEGRGAWTLFLLSLVLLFMLVKALLDFVLRMDFRRNQIMRLATPALMCLALFSLVWIAFSIHLSWGILVLIAFGILAVSLFFVYRNDRKEKVQMKHLILTLLIILATLTLAACSFGNTRLSPAEGAAYAAEVDEIVENMIIGDSTCDYAMFTRDFDSILEDDFVESTWTQKCMVNRGVYGAYLSKTLDHVEDRGEDRTVIYHVAFENDPDITLEVGFWNDDPEYMIIDIDWLDE